MDGIHITDSAAGTEQVAAQLCQTLWQACVRRAFIALEGEMGVGKTVFTRGFAAALGAGGVHSPTYTIVNEYRGGHLPVFHFDLYRLADEDELYAIGFEDYLRQDGYCICEWPCRAGEEIPVRHVTVTITRVAGEETRRRIEIGGMHDSFGL